MTLDQFRPVANRALEPWVNVSDRLGLTPNAVSVVAFVVAVGAAIAYYLGGDAPLWYLLASTLVALNGWLDLLDGALARRQDVDSRAGDLLDHVLDRYADIVIVAGLAAGIDRFGLGLAAVTGVLMTSYLGTQSQAVGLDRAYGGLVGRADRLAIIGIVGYVAVVVRDTFLGLGPIGWVLVFLAVVGHLTAVQRFLGAWRRLE
ncbi:MAG: archaetidylinositol phosphate synthase [Halobacteriales archaeon]|jgi:archaetidylinositol phosphate synthase